MMNEPEMRDMAWNLISRKLPRFKNSDLVYFVFAFNFNYNCSTRLATACEIEILFFLCTLQSIDLHRPSFPLEARQLKESMSKSNLDDENVKKHLK